MSTERDRDMQRLLGSETPPEHGPGFWDGLRSDLRAEAGTDTGNVVSMASRRPLPWLLAAAAIAVIGAAVGFGALRDTSDDARVSTEPDVEDSAPDETQPDPSTTETTVEDTTTTEPSDPETPLMPAGDPIDRGSGTVVGISPDDRWVYVADDAGTGDGGCEGTPQRALYVQPIDGGERRLAAPVDEVDATTMSEIHFDGDGRVAMVLQCEGFNARIVAAGIGADGTLSEIEVLNIDEPECHDGTVDAITDLTYVSPGLLVAATSSFGDGESGCQHLFQLPDTASEPTLLDQQDVYRVETATGGQIVTATADGDVRLNGETIHTTSSVYDIDVSPDGSVVAIAGGDGGVIVPIAGGDPSTFAGAEVYGVTLRDARNGSMLIQGGERLTLAALHLDGDDAITPLTDGNSSIECFFSADGSRLYLTVMDENGENPRVIEQPVTT